MKNSDDNHIFSERDESTRRLPPLLRRAWFSLNQTFRRRIVHLGLTPDQFTILRWVAEARLRDAGRPLTQRNLTDKMASDPNTITSLLNRMEKAKLIRRSPHPTDRRAKCIELLDLGAEQYDKAREIALELQTSVLESIDENRRADFLRDLESIADAARRQLDEM